MSTPGAGYEYPPVAFIGGGNMAAALIGGLRAHGWPASQINVAERDADRRDWLTRELGVNARADAATAIDGAAATVLAVKPQQMAAAVDGLRFSAGSLVLSIAAGIRLDSLRDWLGADLALVRSMPNTPAQVYDVAVVSPLQAAPKLSARLDNTVLLKREDLLDAVTALSGSGPAYFLLLTEAMATAGEALGLTRDTATTLARQTLIGSGRLLEADAADVATLRARVTSKGGTTEAALASLENAGLRAIIHNALSAAARRSLELGATASGPARQNHAQTRR